MSDTLGCYQCDQASLTPWTLFTGTMHCYKTMAISAMQLHQPSDSSLLLLILAEVHWVRDLPRILYLLRKIYTRCGDAVLRLDDGDCEQKSKALVSGMIWRNVTVGELRMTFAR